MLILQPRSCGLLDGHLTLSRIATHQLSTPPATSLRQRLRLFHGLLFPRVDLPHTVVGVQYDRNVFASATRPEIDGGITTWAKVFY